MVDRTGIGLRRELFIGGRWQPASDGQTRPVINPANGEVIAEVPEATLSDLDAALASATAAQPAWEALPAIERAAYLHRMAALVEENGELLARIITSEMGKTIVESRGEVAATARQFTFFAEFARRIEGEVISSENRDEEILITRVPYGVVAAIIPWNAPNVLCARKIAPALIAGNTVVLKPSSETPLSALAIAEIVDRSGLPAGVVNVITGSGKTIGDALVADPRTDLVTMTGSGEVGKHILEIASGRVTPVSLELGGKAPFIVLADADIDLAVRSAVISRYANCGQVCTCNERTLVERSVYEQFVEKYIDVVRRLRVGDPTDEITDVGPKVSRVELEKVEAIVERARQEGAQVELGGKRPEGPAFGRGFWYAPTVLTGLRPEMEIMHEEVFGPVTSIMPFDDFDEGMALANDCKYGLSAYLFTNNLRYAMSGIKRIRFGELYINRRNGEAVQGFHVGYRESGLGGDDGKHGLELYLRKKSVYINYSGKPVSRLMPYGEA